MGDYIDREATIGYIEKKKRELGITNCNACNFKDILRAQPAADVRPVVRGRWEWMGPCRDSGGRLWATCTACGLRQRLGDFTMFCPHCGADIRGGLNNDA